MKRVLVLCAIAVVVWTACAYAAPVGKITHLEGRVDVLKAGRNTASPVTLGAPVDIGDIYRAKSVSRAEITFNNRNLIRIAANTRAEIKEYMVQGEKSSGIVRLHRGRVQAVAGEDLIKRVAAFAEGNRFEVHTQNAVAGVRGTNMLVASEKGTTVVIFLSGHGYLYNPARPEVITPISAGNMAVVPSASSPASTTRPASDAQIRGFIQAVTASAPTASQASSATTAASSGAGTTGFSTVDLGSAAGAGGLSTTGSGSQLDQFTGGTTYVQQQQQQQQQTQQQQQQTQGQTTSTVEGTGALGTEAIVGFKSMVPSIGIVFDPSGACSIFVDGACVPMTEDDSVLAITGAERTSAVIWATWFA